MALLPHVKLLPHQVAGVSFMLSHNYVLNADEQGLGKTLQSIAIQQAEDLDCLVICPATLKYKWQDEFYKFTDICKDEVVVGVKKKKVNIVNYENIYKCTELFHKADLVIIDESHYLIHMDSQRTEYAHRMISKYKPERLILLTGTPVKNRVTDFYSIIRMLCYTPIKNNGRSILDKFKTQKSFSEHFCYKKVFKKKITLKRGGSFTKTFTQYTGCRREDELKVYMRFKYIRRIASKVLNLPALTFKDVQVSYRNNPALKREWDKFNAGDEYNTTVKVESAVKTAPYTASYVIDLLKSGDFPIVVFSDHLEPLEIIEKELIKKKLKVAKIIGKTKLISRKHINDSFQNGELDVILCSIKAANTGIDLFRARSLVLNDEPWDASALSQLIKRIHRIGQDRKCIIHKIIGSTVSKKISDSLEEKQRIINKITGE